MVPSITVPRSCESNCRSGSTSWIIAPGLLYLQRQADYLGPCISKEIDSRLSAGGLTACWSFILGNYFFASHILSTMCWWLMAEVDLKPIPVTLEPKVWPCHSQAGWHCTNVEPLCASTSFSVPVGMTFSLKLVKWLNDSAFEMDMSTLKQCRVWPV